MEQKLIAAKLQSLKKPSEIIADGISQQYNYLTLKAVSLVWQNCQAEFVELLKT